MKRIVSLLLAVVMMFGIFSVVATAAEVEYAQTGDENVIHFDARSTGWEKTDKVYCQISRYTTDWQSGEVLCTDNDGDGIWTFDLDKNTIELDPKKYYVVVFSNDKGNKTHNLLMSIDCLDDTVYCRGEKYDDPAENTTVYMAYWQCQVKSRYGPEKEINTVGDVVGECKPGKGYIEEQLFLDFLTNKLEIARKYSGKSDQALIDDIANALELHTDNVRRAIENTGVETDWDYYMSTTQPGMVGSGGASVGPVDPEREVWTSEDEEPISSMPKLPEGADKSGIYLDLDPNFGDGEEVVIEEGILDIGGYDIVCKKVCGTIYRADFEEYNLVLAENKTYRAELSVSGTNFSSWRSLRIDSSYLGYTYTADETWIYKDYTSEMLVGDIDLDGRVSIMDATEIQMILASLKTTPFNFDVIADVDGDDKASVMDATEIQLVLAGLK